MATIACGAVIGVPGNTLVLVVYLGLVVVLVTIDTTEYLVIACICMAVGTKRPGAGMMPGIDRKILSIVIKSRRRPGSGSMARLAIGRELG
jgi:hypothetical protein